MDTSPIRFVNSGVTLPEMATHFVVYCPKCDGKALIAPKDKQHKLTCTKCFHVELPGHWYGAITAIVSVKCRECHAPIRRSASWNRQWQKLATHCDQCGDTCEYEAHLSKHQFFNGRITDTVYGLPLWLQASFRQEIFWAYHYEHLEVLRDYIGAKLRERALDVPNKNRVMVNRLPAFIKKAGNREDLLKCIDQLYLKK